MLVRKKERGGRERERDLYSKTLNGTFKKKKKKKLHRRKITPTKNRLLATTSDDDAFAPTRGENETRNGKTSLFSIASKRKKIHARVSSSSSKLLKEGQHTHDHLNK